MHRTRIRFSKKGPLRFVGHLDFLRAFGEMLMRSGLPCAFSSGFNPHILLSFALPLPLGFESENDYADLVLAEAVDGGEVRRLLNGAAPAGLAVKDARPAADKCASVVAVADYAVQAEIGGDAARRAMSQASIVVPKKTKSGLKNADIRGDIISAEADGAAVRLRLYAGSSRFLHPALAMEGLFGVSPGPTAMSRTEMYRLGADGALAAL